MNKTTQAKLDKAFSEYIRLRDADEKGYCRCISCGKVRHWKEMDAGHYVNRKHMSLRYNESNVHAQCKACNRYDEGNVSGYTLGLIKKYGKQIIERLNVAKNQVNKIDEFQAQLMLDWYRSKVKELKKSKP